MWINSRETRLQVRYNATIGLSSFFLSLCLFFLSFFSPTHAPDTRLHYSFTSPSVKFYCASFDTENHFCFGDVD